MQQNRKQVFKAGPKLLSNRGFLSAMRSRHQRIGPAEAEEIAIRALGFVAGDRLQLGRFLDLTGLTPETLRTAIAGRELQASLLGFLLQDESLLLTFAGSAGIDPAEIGLAHRVLENAGRGQA